MSIATPTDRPSLSTNVALGDPIEFTHFLKRRVPNYGTERTERGNRVWDREDVGRLQWALQPVRRTPTLRGIIIGKRTLADGDVEYEDNWSYFVPKKRHRVYLVAYDMRRKPVHVFAADAVLL